jgi:hypothetical protein
VHNLSSRHSGVAAAGRLGLAKEDELYCEKSIGTTSTLVLLPYPFGGIGTALEQLFLMRFRALIGTNQR